MIENKAWQYLGDGVYVAIQNGMVVLATGSHLSPDNVVYLEPEVLQALMEFVK